MKNFKLIFPEIILYSMCNDILTFIARTLAKGYAWATKRNYIFQKQLSKGVLKKECSKNMQQCTGENPCRRVISIKLQSIFNETTLRHECFPVNLLHIFRTPFYKNSYWELLLIFAWQLLFRRYDFSCLKTTVKKGHLFFWHVSSKCNNLWKSTSSFL